MKYTETLDANESSPWRYVTGRHNIIPTGSLGGGTLTVETASGDAGFTGSPTKTGSFAALTDLTPQVIEFDGLIRFTLAGATNPDLVIEVTGTGAGR